MTGENKVIIVHTKKQADMSNLMAQLISDKYEDYD